MGSGGTCNRWTSLTETDGYAREVTLRYTKSFGAKTSKLRVPQRKDEPDWWEGVLGMLTRPYRLVSENVNRKVAVRSVELILSQNRDDLEDAELETSQVSEAMPMHLNGFKDHPMYVTLSGMPRTLCQTSDSITHTTCGSIIPHHLTSSN